MNYLIFGGEGFIGSHLANYLHKEVGASYDSIYSLDIVEKQKNRPYNYIYCDVTKTIDIPVTNLEDSIIFNLAAIHTTPGHPNHEYFEANILGAENITAFAEKNDIKQIAFTSSIAPYGASEDEKTELTLPMPNTPYGISKFVAEKIHQIWLAKDPINRRLTIVRPGVVFGKGEGGNYTRLYNSMKKGFFFYPGRTDTIKACVYVKDVARILYESLQKSEQYPTLFNLTFYPAPTIEQICEKIASVTSVKKPEVLIPSWVMLFAAKTIHFLGSLVGLKLSGIHPDRVKKVMISTNINGKKLSESPFKLQFTLTEAIADWQKDCGGSGLY